MLDPACVNPTTYRLARISIFAKLCQNITEYSILNICRGHPVDLIIVLRTSTINVALSSLGQSHKAITDEMGLYSSIANIGKTDDLARTAEYYLSPVC
jgi:hypothetical protein